MKIRQAEIIIKVTRSGICPEHMEGDEISPEFLETIKQMLLPHYQELSRDGFMITVESVSFVKDEVH